MLRRGARFALPSEIFKSSQPSYIATTEYRSGAIAHKESVPSLSLSSRRIIDRLCSRSLGTRSTSNSPEVRFSNCDSVYFAGVKVTSRSPP